MTLQDAFARRVTTGCAPDIALTEVVQTILGHKSCRSYADAPLADGLLELLVVAAQSAPSSCNLQAWSVVAVTDPVIRQWLNVVCGDQHHVAHAPVFLCFMIELARLEAISAANQQPGDTLDTLEMLLVGTIDAALAAQNLATAAASHGLGTCYIGGLRNQIDAVAEILALPPRVAPVFGMTLGFPAQGWDGAVKPRLPQALVLHRDTYSTQDPMPAVRAYEQRLGAFEAAPGRQAIPWGQKSAARIATDERLEGRHLLPAKLRAMGLAIR